MCSSIHFVDGFDLDFSLVIIVPHESRGIVDECALDITARFLPGVPFVVELETYGKNYHLVNIQAHVT